LDVTKIVMPYIHAYRNTLHECHVIQQVLFIYACVEFIT